MKRLMAMLCLLTGVAAVPALAQSVDEGPAHPAIPTFQELLENYDSGLLSLNDLRRMGLSVFATPFNTYDGLGDGPFDPRETDSVIPGHRPTLQGNGLFLRVNGLDAQSCNECHTIVSNRTRLPTLGFGGVGGIVQNDIIMPTLIDVADSLDGRVVFQPAASSDLPLTFSSPDLPLEFDGVADYNGRFANPPFLFGGGGVELLAKEMTAALQDLLRVARQSPNGTTIALETHGVNFGSLTKQCCGGRVSLDLDGIGPEKIRNTRPEDILVVRPFGRKGDVSTMREFDQNAMSFHFGLQPSEVVDPDGFGGVDEDGDGVADEVTVAEMTALHIFEVTNPPPVYRAHNPNADKGFDLFKNIGCADCHRPQMKTKTRFLPLAFPEVPTDPSANVYMEIDLVEVGFEPDPDGPGVIVPLFADLKRHNMGRRLAETFERNEVANTDFTTARLWGIADTAPYLHDGRATTLYQAIEFHGGEARSARNRFMNLSDVNQRALLDFLRSLRTPHRPNEDLLPL